MFARKSICFVLVLVFCCPYCFASGKELPLPPQMPTFDEMTVKKMLDSIDQGYNFTLLKAGYFAGHKKTPLPVTKGYEALRDTLEKQQQGSLNWFLLQSLRSFAAFHAKDIPIEEGYEAYGSIFEHATLANTPQTQFVVRSTVRDIVVDIPVIIDRKGWGERMENLLLKAWLAWPVVRVPTIRGKFSLDWGRAIEASEAQDQFIDIVNKFLNDSTHNPSFLELKMAIVVLQDKEPKRAIDILKISQSKLQPDDHYNQQWLYDTWIKLITGKTPQELQTHTITDKSTLAQLVAMRKQQISYTGTGYGDLLELYWELNEQDKAAGLIKTAQMLNIPQKAIAAIGTKLLRPPRSLKFNEDKTQQLQKQGIALLQKYLSSSKTLQPDSEISARLSLGRYYVKQDLIIQALKALDISHLKKPPSYTEASAHYNDLLRLKAALDKKLQGVTGIR